MKVTNEIKIGITVVVAITVAYIGFKLLEDSPLFGQSASYHSYYAQVEGLTEGTPVFAQGVKIGTVRRISLAGLDSVRVDMTIDGHHVISQGAVAVLGSTDILGTKAISVRSSDRKNTVGSDGYIFGKIDEGLMGQVGGIAEKLGPGVTESTNNLASVLKQLNDLLEDGGKDNLSETLIQLKQTSTTVNDIIEERNKDLALSIETLNSILSNIDTLSADRKEQFDRVLNNLETTSEDLIVIGDEFSSLGSELNTLLNKINEGEGTLGKLVHDPGLYNNLDSLSYNLNEFVKKMNEDPKHFLRHLRLIRLF